jgi:hypothetical protein
LLVIGGAIQLLVLGAMLTHRLLFAGAGRRTLAERWSRHSMELPALNRLYTSRWTLYAIAVCVGGYGGTFAAEAIGADALIAPLLLIGLVGQALLQGSIAFRLTRSSTCRGEALALREAQRAQLRR